MPVVSSFKFGKCIIQQRACMNTEYPIGDYSESSPTCTSEHDFDCGHWLKFIYYH